MMRRLLVLFLLLFGMAGVAPAAPAPASHHRTAAHAAMPGGCHGEGQAAAHVCIGCAVVPDAIAAVARPDRVAPPPGAPAPAALAGRSPGDDPPPPRAAS